LGIEAFAVVPRENPIFPERVTVAAFDNRRSRPLLSIRKAVRCGPLVALAGHIPIATNKGGKPVINGFDDVAEEGLSLPQTQDADDRRRIRR
jgi:hypothetical protein